MILVSSRYIFYRHYIMIRKEKLIQEAKITKTEPIKNQEKHW